jgi:hypothetical protein
MKLDNLLEAAKKITDKNLSVDELYINLKTLREAVKDVEQNRNFIEITVSGKVGTNKSAIVYVIKKALENADITCFSKDLDVELNMVSEESLMYTDLSNNIAFIKELCTKE